MSIISGTSVVLVCEHNFSICSIRKVNGHLNFGPHINAFYLFYRDQLFVVFL